MVEQSSNPSTGGPTTINATKGGTPVGLADVVKMEYVLGYGRFDLGMTEPLAWTDSFKEGISLSEIQWTFVNTGSQKGTETTGKISFTLHDIAGLLFEKFMHLKTGIDFIYFYGPTSDGKLWTSGVPSLYQVDPSACSLEFSATQGFTYTFSGISAVTASRSKKLISAPAEFGLSGTINGTNQTFAQSVQELVQQWNAVALKSGKPNSQIELIIDESKEINSKYMKRQPVSVDKQNGGDNNKTFSFKVSKGDTIHKAVTELWFQIFQNSDEKKCDNDLKMHVKPRVDFVKWGDGGKITCQILFSDKTVDDALNNRLRICVGDDDNCRDAQYRGELAGINLNDIASQFLIPEDYAGSEAGGTAPAGSEEKTEKTTCKKDVRKYPNDHGNATQSSMDWKSNGFLKSPEGGKISGYWGQMYNLIHDNTATPLEIEINMPYTSDFTPKIHCGILKCGIEGMASTIDLTQGADLDFFWYDNPNCDKLVISSIISSHYRISEVSHQIGLSGNQTVVKLSHLQLNA